jgi:hypothetical protein
MRLGVRTRKEGGSFGSMGQRWVWYIPSAEDVAEDVAEAAEDVRESGNQHLQANCADKDTYGNGLAEDVAPPFSQHLQQLQQHLQGVGEPSVNAASPAESAPTPHAEAPPTQLREIFEF